jgi:tRNA U34 5-carboxymethylaminomethyl modifying GTPase MnmE/TrmE
MRPIGSLFISIFLALLYFNEGLVSIPTRKVVRVRRIFLETTQNGVDKEPKQQKTLVFRRLRNKLNDNKQVENNLKLDIDDFVEDPLVSNNTEESEKSTEYRDRFLSELKKSNGIEEKVPDNFLSGFVSIIGNPNVGKSTLLNALLGQKLSIVSSKPQTTRHRIFGVANEPTHQIVYIDTPGMLKPVYTLQETMQDVVRILFEYTL